MRCSSAARSARASTSSASPTSSPASATITSYLIPLVLYFVYTTRMMPGLSVFKHALRGYSYMSIDRLRLALRFFNRALELDPRSQLANTGLVALHNNLTLTKIDNDPELVNELDFSLCLDRAATLLMPPNPPPSPQARDEAERFLSLVEQKKPAYLARVDYLRVISRMHAKEYDAAAEILSRLLNPETPGYHPKVRNHVLFDAWDLALRLHPRLVERLGFAELNKPGRRIEAIGAVERKLAAEPTHPAAKEYRTLLYSQLQEGEFIAAMGAAGHPPKDFAYEYVEQLGLALVDDADPERRERGMGYLRMAGRGLPERGPGIYTKLAQVYDKHGDAANAKNSLEMAKQVGLAVGPRNLARDQWNSLPRRAPQTRRPRRPARRLRNGHQRTAPVPGGSRPRGARNVPQARGTARQAGKDAPARTRRCSTPFS